MKRALLLATGVEESEVVFVRLCPRVDRYESWLRTSLNEQALKVIDSIVATARSIEYLFDLETANCRARLGTGVDHMAQAEPEPANADGHREDKHGRDGVCAQESVYAGRLTRGECLGGR